MFGPSAGVHIFSSSLTYRQTEWAGIVLPNVLVQEALRFEHDFLVVVELVAADADSSLKNGAGVVVPFETGVWLVPVHAPTEIAGVDVTGETLLVAVQLIANEVHLACEGGLVSCKTEVVRVGKYVAANLGSVVIGCNLHGQLARDHTHARRGAEWRGAVC